MYTSTYTHTYMHKFCPMYRIYMYTYTVYIPLLVLLIDVIIMISYIDKIVNEKKKKKCN